MRTAIWPADFFGCGHYRLLFVAKVLADQGADVVVDTTGPNIVWNSSWEGLDRPGPDQRILGIAGRYPADVVVFQRPARRWWADLIPHLHAQGTRVVVDVDDRFDAVKKEHSGYLDMHGDIVNPTWVEAACRQADLVTCTTTALLDRYGYGHGVVLPNLVPAYYLDIVGIPRPNTVGWSGFVSTHPGDLAVTQGGVAQALAQTGWSFFVVGMANGVAGELGLPEEPESSKPVQFAEYIWALAEMDVGIVPLEDNPFNRAKSCLKMLEMASVGVPVVASPTPDNLRLNRLGIGLIAEGRGQWRRSLLRLMNNEQERLDVAEKGKEVVATLTYELGAEAWLDAWEGRTEGR